MQIAQHGIILFVERYDACVRFYRDRLELPIAYEKGSLTCFAFGSAYLMVEQGGVACLEEKRRAQNPTVLRFDVEDLQSVARELQAKGVAIQLRSFDWGEIGAFTDPDGNRCELKQAVRSESVR